MACKDRVSIHAPAWGATGSLVLHGLQRSCFNPRTRVGCDVGMDWRQRIGREFQSTHPRGVRPTGYWRRCWRTGVSIHAPAWGATRRPALHIGYRVEFQSTHPRGVRRSGAIMGTKTSVVSIHAPAWGATGARPPGIRWMPCFNPRTRVGCDSSSFFLIISRACFNPRTRVGCDLPPELPGEKVAGFNPRTRVGCDSERSNHGPHLRCFNPRTRVGCDECKRQFSVVPKMFQSTHPRGVRPKATQRERAEKEVSIHAPAWGATRLVRCSAISAAVSIHAPAWGATWNYTNAVHEHFLVSIHAPAWGATPVA